VAFEQSINKETQGRGAVSLHATYHKKITSPSSVTVLIGFLRPFSSKRPEVERARHDNDGGNFSPLLLEIRVQKGNRKDLGRPTTTPIENKEALMDFLKQ
jgi:hypothetical protein